MRVDLQAVWAFADELWVQARHEVKATLANREITALGQSSENIPVNTVGTTWLISCHHRKTRLKLTPRSLSEYSTLNTSFDLY